MVQITEICIGNPNEYISNILSSQGIHYSRYIASWVKEGGNFKGTYRNGSKQAAFVKWLYHLGLGEDESYEIWKLAVNGKFELEYDAKKFISELGRD